MAGINDLLTPELTALIYGIILAAGALILKWLNDLLKKADETKQIAVQNQAKINSIDTAQTVQMAGGTTAGAAINQATIIEPAPVVQGVWSEAATKALEKAIPAGATITGTYDDEFAHIIYWTVKT